MISETKTDGHFLVSHFLLGGYTASYRLDQNSNVGGILVFIRKDIPSTKLHCFYAGFEGLFIELNLIRTRCHTI